MKCVGSHDAVCLIHVESVTESGVVTAVRTQLVIDHRSPLQSLAIRAYTHNLILPENFSFLKGSTKWSHPCGKWDPESVSWKKSRFALAASYPHAVKMSVILLPVAADWLLQPILGKFSKLRGKNYTPVWFTQKYAVYKITNECGIENFLFDVRKKLETSTLELWWCVLKIVLKRFTTQKDCSSLGLKDHFFENRWKFLNRILPWFS